MSIKDITIVITSFKSDEKLKSCLNSINRQCNVIIVENSNNQRFKEDLESQYKNLKCILSKSNIGMGAGNNIGIKSAKTDYVYILNPDATLEPNTLDEIFLASKKVPEFSILSPINADLNFPNYKKSSKEKYSPFQVEYVDGFSMLLNKKKFKDNIYFDENFFLYLENNDLCLRVSQAGGSIFIVPTAKINHGGAKTVDSKHKNEVELSRNWHWIWSKFYFSKKHFGFLKATMECLPTYISSILKFLFYLLINNKFKKKIYFNRASGFYNALLGKSSWYRPKIDN